MLPVELLDMVFEEASDHADLKAWSLVCKLWRKVGLQYLFGTTVVKPPAGGHFEDLSQFLRDHPHVANNIRTLTLKGPKHEWSRQDIPLPRLDTTTVMEIMHCLSNIRVLEVSRVNIVEAAHAEDPSVSLNPTVCCILMETYN